VVTSSELVHIRSTNCANAPYGFPEVFRGSFLRFTSAGLVTVVPSNVQGFPDLSGEVSSTLRSGGLGPGGFQPQERL